MFAKSFGGLLAYNLSIRYPNLFKGASLIAPFFQHYTDTIEKYQYLFKFAYYFQLYFSFSMRDPSKPGYKEYVEKYGYILADPKVIYLAKISTIVLFYDEQ